MKKQAWSSNPFLTFDWHTSRKVYHCKSCGETIPVGVKYFRMAGKCKETGEFFDHTFCEKCGKVQLFLLDI